MLTLPIKKKWFDMIYSGEKTEEYREISAYFERRLQKYVGHSLNFGLRNGYSPKSPVILCHGIVDIGFGKPEWGAEPGKLYYILKIRAIFGRKNVGEVQNE
jgi:hypothetical protein